MGSSFAARPVDALEGIVLTGGWTIGPPLVRPPGATGGTFSVGYRATRRNEEAFLKALDFMAAFQSNDWTVRMQQMLAEYNYERDISIRLSNINRVVTTIGAGSVDVPGFPPPTNKVSYILFEMANGDIRTNGYEDPAKDTIALKLRALHNISDGLSHIHSRRVTHQDLKPSNVFTFHADECKIGDLGCSSDDKNGSPNDQYFVAGDPGYLPPEYEYPNRKISGLQHDDRKALDLYHLGSLVYFVFGSGASARSELKFSMQKLGYVQTGNWTDDLTVLESAFADSLIRLEESLIILAPNLAPRIVNTVKELCNPDPDKRGSKKCSDSITRLNAQRYVSLFDHLATKAEFGML